MTNRFNTKQDSVNVLDVIKELPRGFSRVIGQPTLRAFGGIASGIRGEPFTPTGEFQKQLYGTDKPITLGSTGRELRGGLGGEKLKIDPALGLFAGLADLVPGAKGVKQTVTPLSKLILAIKSAQKATPKIEALQSAERTKRAGAVSGVFSEQKGQTGYFQALGKLKGELTEKPSFKPLGVTDNSTTISPKLQPLAEEARKYKSAEEFVNKQSKTRNPSVVIDFLRKDRFNLGFERSKFPYHFTSTEDKAFELVQNSIYAIGNKEFNKARNFLSQFTKYRDENRLNPVFTQRQVGTGESLKEGGKNARLGAIDRFFQEATEMLTEKSQLTDFYNKVNKGAEIQGILSRADVDNLFNTVQAHPTLDVYEKVSASNGLQKLLGGQLPQRSQLSLMEDVFGSELITEVLKKRPFLSRLGDIITETQNVPRSLVTSLDMSGVLRQGILFSTTKPIVAVRALREMFRQTFSPENFKTWLEEIPQNPRYIQMKGSGLYLADPTRISGGLAAREEKFMTNIAQKIPFIGAIVRASERAFVSFLNKLRVDVFTQLATKFEKEGNGSAENLKSLANFINNATGRGDLGKFSHSAQALNTIFFSPRLIAARFNMLNPVWYAKQTPPVRKEAIKTMAQFIGVGATILAIAKAGGAEVETDTRSSDFGKIRVGNVRMDIWGGFQQWVRVFSQLVSGQRKTTKGDVVELTAKQFPFDTRLDVGARFLRGKLAPVPSLVLELMEGQKLFGEAITLPKEVAENTIPLYLQDMEDAIKQIGPEAILTVGLPAFFGVGAQVYQERGGGKNRFSR